MRFSRLIAVSLLTISPLANAGWWYADSVANGSGGGFAFSVLHDNSSTGVMSGSQTDRILDGDSWYNDVTGQFIGNYFLTSLDSTVSQGTMDLAGTLPTGGGYFPVPSVSQLSATFGGASSHVDTTYNFTGGDQCCSADPNDPNSFVVSGGVGTMTLWGSNGTVTQSPSGEDSWSDFSQGIDLRLEFTQTNDLPPGIPIPAAAWLFGSALLGLAVVGRRRSRRT